LKELIENILMEETTLITGSPGIGKTTLALTAAWVLRRPVEIFSYGGVFDPDASISGQLTLRDGKTEFVRSRLVDALTVPDCIVVLDEIARAPAEVPNALLSLLDFQKRLVLDLEAPDNRVVECAPGITFVATANLGAGCIGSGPLDRAFLDRMLHLHLEYPDPKAEARLLVEYGLKARAAAQLVKKANVVRAEYSKGVLPESLSTRGVIRAAKLMVRGNPIDRAIERNMHLLEEASRAKLRTILKAVA
jgi:MoxR-like ATPase